MVHDVSDATCELARIVLLYSFEILVDLRVVAPNKTTAIGISSFFFNPPNGGFPL